MNSVKAEMARSSSLAATLDSADTGLKDDVTHFEAHQNAKLEEGSVKQRERRIPKETETVVESCLMENKAEDAKQSAADLDEVIETELGECLTLISTGEACVRDSIAEATGHLSREARGVDH